jgi:hypothetical protein
MSPETQVPSIKAVRTLAPSSPTSLTTLSPPPNSQHQYWGALQGRVSDETALRHGGSSHGLGRSMQPPAGPMSFSSQHSHQGLPWAPHHSADSTQALQDASSSNDTVLTGLVASPKAAALSRLTPQLRGRPAQPAGSPLDSSSWTQSNQQAPALPVASHQSLSKALSVENPALGKDGTAGRRIILKWLWVPTSCLID